MPYNSIEELPESVRKHLPLHAQEIYCSAFNSAWISYANRGRWGMRRLPTVSPGLP